jgi:OOP family OmpA-OmpF porin
MKHFTLYVFGMLLISLYSNAQALLMREEFDQDKGSWIVKNNASIDFRIENGVYSLQDKDTSQRWYCWKDVNYFSHKLDFEIEAKIKFKAGSSKCKFGIAWALADLKNLNTFGITGDGNFFIQSKINDEYKSEVPLTPSTAIKGIGSYNLLKIKSVGNTISYYVNDSLIKTTNKPAIKGPNIGFLVDKNSSIEVDWVQIKQDAKINLLENSVKGRKCRSIEKINTKYTENGPLISADGKTLYFSRDGHPENIGSDYKTDCWYVKKDDKGWYSEPVNMGKPLNNKSHNFIIYVSPDEHTMVMANQYDANGEFKASGISITNLTANGWSIPQDIKIEDYKNELSYVEYCFSSNRKVLISAIKNENSIGNNDLFVSFQIDDKTYSKPIDMGSAINTLHSESCPKLSADGKKLYFSSNGHPGYGFYDIFVSERLDDSWLKWSTPKNLGPEINTADNEMNFQLNADGDVGYFTSDRNADNELDIFEFYTEEKKLDSLCVFSGVVTDAATDKPIAAEITFFNAPGHKEILLSKSNPTDGTFKGSLPSHNNYDYYGIKKGYYGVTSRINLDLEDAAKSTYTITMKLYPVQKGLSVPMPNLSFDDKNQPTNYAMHEVNRLLHLMEEYPNMVIQLKTPATGSQQNIAQAEAIKNYLISKGVKANRIQKTELGKYETFDFKIVSTEEIKEQVVIQNSFSNQIKVNEIKKGQKFKIENLYFMADSTSFTVASYAALSDLADFLKQNKNLKIEIGGHTNGLPAHEYCDKLSNDRAKSVFLFLINKGVDEKMISFKGYGKREPVSDNSTEAGRARNQRVELKVIDIY